MKAKKHDTRWMVSVALMAAIVIVLANTPLGMIQLPIIKATTVHIPVILGAILLGPGAGAILGAVFGICSLVSNTMAPTLLSFAFSPFLSTTGIPGALKAIWISVGCRILIGVAAGWLWVLFTKIKLNQFIALPIVGFVGEYCHCNGKYLFPVCTAVCRGERSRIYSSIRSGDGNCDSIRYSGSNRSSNSRSCTWKSTCCSFPQDESWGRECGVCKITDRF